MKILIFLITFSSFSFGATTVLDCLQDASDYGSHTNPVKPSEECYSLISQNENKLELKSSDKSVSVIALGNMVYVKTAASYELLAGPQTGLKSVEKIWIDTKHRRLFVHQTNELLTFDLDFIGNVQPLKLLRSTKLQSVKNVELKDERLNLSFEDGSRLGANADAESRNLSSKKDVSWSN